MSGNIHRQAYPFEHTAHIPHCARFGIFILVLCLPLTASAAMPDNIWPTVSAHLHWPGGMPIAIIGVIIAGMVLGWGKEQCWVEQAESARQARIAQLEAAQLAIQTEGNESEQQVGDTLLAWARELDPGATLQTGVIVRYPDSRLDQVSKFEIDCLLVTCFGTFVVEVKNWKHPVSVSANGWAVDKPSGREDVKSPLAQNQPKQRMLQALASEIVQGERPITVHSVVILPHRQAHLAMQVQPEAMYLHEARLLLRQAYHAIKKAGLFSSEQLERFTARLHHHVDTDPFAKHYFLLELHDKKGFAAEYKALDVERLALISAPQEEPRPVWKCGATYVPTLALVAWMAIGAQWSGLAHKNTPATATPAVPAVSKPASKAAPASPPAHKVRHRHLDHDKRVSYTGAVKRT